MTLYLIVWIEGDKPRGTVSCKTLNEEIPIFNLAVEDTTLLFDDVAFVMNLAGKPHVLCCLPNEVIKMHWSKLSDLCRPV